MSETVKLKLLVPITAYNEQVTELTFRPPLGRDMRLCGQMVEVFPDPVKGTGQVSRVSNEAVARYISTLANIPPGAVDRLSAQDFMACIGIINGFFVDGDPTNSSQDTSTSPGSTDPLTPST